MATRWLRWIVAHLQGRRASSPPKKVKRLAISAILNVMDVERAMQFIIEHQAKLTASVEKHDEQIAKLEQSVATITDLVGRLAQAEIRLVERMEGLAKRMESLAEWMDGLAEQMEGHEARLQSLETKATSLFERMDRFIQGLEGNGRKSR